jgi:integration host factor subunit alpha
MTTEATTDDQNITRQDITKRLLDQLPGLTQKDANAVVDSIIDTMRDTLAKGEEVKISGFGKFVVKAKNARVGRNPQTGEPVHISARRVLKFKPSDVLKSILNDSI